MCMYCSPYMVSAAESFQEDVGLPVMRGAFPILEAVVRLWGGILVCSYCTLLESSKINFVSNSNKNEVFCAIANDDSYPRFSIVAVFM